MKAETKSKRTWMAILFRAVNACARIVPAWPATIAELRKKFIKTPSRSGIDQTPMTKGLVQESRSEQEPQAMLLRCREYICCRQL